MSDGAVSAKSLRKEVERLRRRVAELEASPAGALAAREERLEMVVRAGELGTWDRDLTTGEMTWNDLLYDLLGRERGSAITGETFFEHIHPDDVGRVRRHVEEKLESGGEFVDEFRIVRRDGEIRWLAARGQTYFDDDGRPLRMAGVNFDVTDRAWARESLRESEQRFRAVIEDAPIPVMLHTLDGDILVLSRAFTEITGYTLDDIPNGREWVKRGHDVAAEDSDAFDRQLRDDQAKAVGASPVQDERGVRTHSGDIRTWLFRGSHVGTMPDGRELMVTMAVDITERRAAEQAIANLARFPQENPNPVLRISADGDLMYTNAAAREVLRLCGAADAGKPPLAWCRVAREARETSQLRRVEIECGDQIFAMAFAPVVEAGYVNVYGLNITQRKRAEDTILRARKELERQLKTREMELGGVLWTLQDATAGRDEAEEKLRETTAVLERIFDNTHMLIAYLDRDLRFIRVNRAYAEADDRRPEFFVGKAHFDLYPNSENERIFRNVVETGEPHHAMANLFEYADSSRRGPTWWDWSLQPVANEDGEVEAVILCLVDVTEEQEAEHAVQRAREYAVNIVQTLREGLLTLDSDLRVVTANRTFYRMFQVTPEETIGQYVYDLGDRQWDIPRLRELLEEVIPRSESLVDFEVEHDFERIGWRVMMLNARRMPGVAGDEDRVLLAIQDVTERRRIVRELERSFGQLRALVERMESIREEERVRISREIHDRLGQELTAFKTGLGMLKKKMTAAGGAEADWLDRLGYLSEAADAAISSVRRISAELRPSVLDNLGLSDAIEQELERFEERTGVACRFSDGGSMPLTPERTTAMFRIFQEALTNIERHAQASHARVSLRARAGEVMLEVEDDGVGLSEKQQNAPAALGLLGMSERATACDGTVTIKGIPGKGTQVSVTFPATQEPDES
jgi:PAS domain S-box-containing protein